MAYLMSQAPRDLPKIPRKSPRIGLPNVPKFVEKTSNTNGQGIKTLVTTQLYSRILTSAFDDTALL
jgi:hypothetical protein